MDHDLPVARKVGIFDPKWRRIVSDVWEYKLTPIWASHTSEELTAELNACGKEGWEYVSTIEAPEKHSFVLWKRRPSD